MARLSSIVDRLDELFNARDWDGCGELLDEQVEQVMSGIAIRGRAGVIDFLKAATSTRPALRIGSRRLIAETEDTLVSEVRMIEEVPELEYSAGVVQRVAGGRIVEWLVYVDRTAEASASAAFMAVAAEQSALRRVAELVARQALPEQVFDLVTDELSQLVEVDLIRMVRFEPDGSATVVAARGLAEDPIPPGTNAAIPNGSVIDKVSRTARPARVDDYAKVGGPIGARLAEEGAGSAAGGPIVVDGRVWGAMVACRTAGSLPPATEDRVAQFAELVSTTISNIESRARVERLVAEQSALRRVADLVAAQPPPEQVFALVTEELSQLMDVSLARMVRFEADGSATVLAVRGSSEDRLGTGTNHPLPRGTLIEQVFRTGKPARVEDYAQVTDPIGDVLRREGTRSGAGGPIIVDGRLWGAMVVGSRVATLPPAIEDRVGQFAELVSTAISNIESRGQVERLASEQSALRRVATLVARAPASEQLLSAVAREVASVLDVPGVIVTRDEADGTVVTLGEAFDSDLAGAERFYGVGTRTPRDPGSLAAQVFETHRPARIDDFSALAGTIGDRARAAGFGSGCASPIMVNGALWGKMCVFSPVGTVLPVGTENRLHEFIELIATAVANYEAHADLAASEAHARGLAEEQAALRRVATLVAEGATPNRVFDAVRDEVEQMFGIPNTILMRFDPSGTATLLATPGDYLGPVGKRWSLEGDDSAVACVYRTGRAARADYTAGAYGPLADAAQRGGTRFPVAVPVVVEGELWGAMSVGSPGPVPPPPDLESRLAKFTEVLATAIGNAENRADLAASHARTHELAEEQAALRRVATLVARGMAPRETFSAVCEEVGRVFGSPYSGIARFERDGSGVVIVGLSEGISNIPIGTRWPFEEFMATTLVYRTGRPARNERSGWEDTSGPVADRLRELGLVSTVAAPIVVEGDLWGLITISDAHQRLPPDAEERLAAFTELVAMAIANAESRADLAASEARARELADEQSALRRVATLVAQGASADELFAFVSEEVGRLFDAEVAIGRYEPDEAGVVVVGLTSGHPLSTLGALWELEDLLAATAVYRTGRSARTDYKGVEHASGAVADKLRALKFVSTVAAPIVVESKLWGVICVTDLRGKLPDDAEERVGKFTELVGTAIANAESRGELAASEARARELANEQAGLRRVATLVAHGASPDELFSAVSREAAAVIDVPIVSIQRYEADGTFTILGNAGTATRWIGTQWPIRDEALEGMILATGRPSRSDDFNTLPGPLGDPRREALRASWQGVRSVVGVPIIVEGSIWGFMSAAAEPGRTVVPAGTEERLARFTELVATAVSNATTRTELLASRARVVSAADETRRRLERDLHDGIQQWLVALALRARKVAGLPTAGDSADELSGLADELVAVTDELRELSHGIHPAVLSDAGLDDALKALARRSAIEVDLDVSFQGRYDPTLEATAYYVVAESITNAVKHAQASTVTVRGGRRDGAIELEIRDHGVGGADPRHGTGLIGLKDRVDTLGGTISFASPAGAGTTIRMKLPTRQRNGDDRSVPRPDEAASASASGKPPTALPPSTTAR